MLISFRVTCTSRLRLNLITYVNQSGRGIILRPFFVCFRLLKRDLLPTRFQNKPIFDEAWVNLIVITHCFSK